MHSPGRGTTDAASRHPRANCPETARVIPLQDLLHRIRWDAEFGAARFEVAYQDHLRREPARVPLDPLGIPHGKGFFVPVPSPDGELCEIPLHRIRAVWRDGVLIWQRP